MGNTFICMYVDYPFAKRADIMDLSLKTGLEGKKISQWLHHQRKRSNKLLFSKPRKCFAANEIIILEKYYTTQTTHPGPKDLELLAKLINKDAEKIRAWFNKKKI